MRQVNVHEAKTQLSRLLEEVERGEEVTIARNGVPVAVLSKAPAATRGGFGMFSEYAGLADQIAALDDEVVRIVETEAEEEHRDFLDGQR